MSSLNKVMLIGNLGRDPEGKDVGGSRMVNLSVATSEKWTDKSTGERKEKTEWHRVVIWDEKLGEIAERYLRKGSKVYLDGQLQTRKWQKDGQDRYSTEIVLQRFRGEIVMLGDKGGAAAGSSDDWQAPVATGGGAAALDLDDEIPF